MQLQSLTTLINPTVFQTSILYMKRFRLGEEETDHQMDMAGMLILLSCGHDGKNNNKEDCQSLISPPRVFRCKTCSRQFQSFQALGGHRASHKKPRADGVCNSNVQTKPRVHECSICGLEFAVGQALGGHMRRHRAHHAQGGEKKRVWLDLNLPPLESYEMMNVPIVDCFQ